MPVVPPSTSKSKSHGKIPCKQHRFTSDSPYLLSSDTFLSSLVPNLDIVIIDLAFNDMPLFFHVLALDWARGGAEAKLVLLGDVAMVEP